MQGDPQGRGEGWRTRFTAGSKCITIYKCDGWQPLILLRLYPGARIYKLRAGRAYVVWAKKGNKKANMKDGLVSSRHAGNRRRIDGHIHLERGAYTLEWIGRFIDHAVENNLDEIWLLEHCYRFREFAPMYDSVRGCSDYIDKWFHRKAALLGLSDYTALMDRARAQPFPISVKFGLEVCYFREFENFVQDIVENEKFDFVVGSVHYVDGFAFDHIAELWDGADVDKTYRRYFETSVDLAESGLFDGIAHPDCIKLFGHAPAFALEEYYETLARALSANRMYAEQSSGIFRRCPDTAELGMNADLLKRMKAHRVTVITASDAHCPEDVGAHIPELSRLIDQA